jgi:formylglycine-generating enzyme required for sulfatase activity
MDPVTFEYKQPMKTGIRYVEEWPWGAQSPDKMADISEYAVTPFGANPAPGIQPVGGRKPNGYGLHDMIGNVAELTMEWYIDPGIYHPDSSMGMMPVSNAVGGSFSKLHIEVYDPYGNQISPRSVMSLGQSLPDTGSPEVGFRAIRIEF